MSSLLFGDQVQAFRSALIQHVATSREAASDRELTDLYATAATVYAAANLRARAVAAVPFKVVDGEGEDVPLAEPVARLFRRGLREVMRRSELAIFFWGRNLLSKQRNLYRVTQRLRWVNPNLWVPEVDPGQGLRGFRIYRSGGSYQPQPATLLAPRDVVFMHTVDFADDFDGVAPAEVCFLEAGLSVEIAQTAVSFFRNHAIPALILQPAPDTQSGATQPREQEMRTLVGFLRRFVQGSRNAGRSLVAPTRWEAVRLQQDFDELAMGELKEETRRDVAMAAEVPLALLMSDASSYAELYDARRGWYEGWVGPQCEWYAELLTEQLAAEVSADWRVVPDFGQVAAMKESAASLTGVVNAQVQGGYLDLYTAQQKLGLEPDEAFRDLYVFGGVPVPKVVLPRLWQIRFGASGGAAIEDVAAEPPPGSADQPPPERPLRPAGEDGGFRKLPPRPAVPERALMREQSGNGHPAELGASSAPAAKSANGSGDPAVSSGSWTYRHPSRAGRKQPAVAGRAGPAGAGSSDGDHQAETLTQAAAPLRQEPDAPIQQAAGDVPVQQAAGDVPVQQGLDVPVSAEERQQRWLPDPVFKELRDWSHIVARKGADYAFAPQALPQDTAAYLRLLLGTTEKTRALPDLIAAGRAHYLAHHGTPEAAKGYAETALRYRAALYDLLASAFRLGEDGLPTLSRAQFGEAGRAEIAVALQAAFLDGLRAAGVQAETMDQVDPDEARDLALEVRAERSNWTALANELYRRALPLYRKALALRVTAQHAPDETERRALLRQADEALAAFNAARDDFVRRIDLWVNKGLRRIFDLGRLAARANPMLKWRLGSTSEHCRTCLAASGQVHRKKTWLRYGLLPRSDVLECGGFRCGCELEETGEPARGRLDRVPLLSGEKGTGWQPAAGAGAGDLADVGYAVSLAADPQVAAIADAARVRVEGEGVDWVDPLAWHLSLVYAAGPQPMSVIAALADDFPITDAEPLLLQVAGFAVWDTERDGRPAQCLVALVEAREELLAIQRRLYEQFAGRGLEVAEHTTPEAYRPHVTLAYGERIALSEAEADLGLERTTIELDNICLTTPEVTLLFWSIEHDDGESEGELMPEPVEVSGG